MTYIYHICSVLRQSRRANFRKESLLREKSLNIFLDIGINNDVTLNSSTFYKGFGFL